MLSFPFHYEIVVTLNVPPETAFEYLDDFQKLSGHMQRSSSMMIGMKMTVTTDSLHGRAVGSRVRMEGKMLGIRFLLEERIIKRDPPTSKIWQTMTSHLLVIGQYRLGFALAPSGDSALLHVFIDYELPHGGFPRWLGRLFGRKYAKWCVDRMANDAVAYFSPVTV